MNQSLVNEVVCTSSKLRTDESNARMIKPLIMPVALVAIRGIVKFEPGILFRSGKLKATCVSDSDGLSSIWSELKIRTEPFSGWTDLLSSSISNFLNERATSAPISAFSDTLKTRFNRTTSIRIGSKPAMEILTKF